MPNYLPESLPSPHPSHDDLPFWDYCRKHELRIQQCAVCDAFRHPALKEVLPYNIAVVLLEGAGTVRLVSNVIDAAPYEMHVDLTVELVWEDLADGMTLPRFRKRKELVNER